MPGRLIGFILLLVVIVTFIGFNVDNTSDIRYWFGETGVLHDVPIFVSFFFMYLVGVLSVVPFLIGWRLKKSRGEEKHEEENQAEDENKKKRSSVRILGRKKSSRVRGRPEGRQAENR